MVGLFVARIRVIALAGVIALAAFASGTQGVSADSDGIFAVVNGDGTLIRGGTVSSATRLGPGRYEVTFLQNVSACAYTATIGDTANALVYYPGLVFTAGGHAPAGGADPNGVYVETKNLGGGLSDFPFHLNVSCTSTVAVVNSDGTLVRGANAIAATQLGPGRYEITFDQDVSGCAYTATIGDPANALVYYPGLVFTAGGHGADGADPNGVYVETKNLGGGLSSFPFHLNVTCVALFAVVNGDGSQVRGANVISTTQLGPGRYEITFDQDVSGCAYTATIGDPANALVYYPGLVFTAGGHGANGPDPNGVYVETKNLGGGLSNFPFHLNVSC